MPRVKDRSREIRTVGELRDYLETACFVELSTIPAYLSALYSIKPRIPKAATSTASVYTPLGAYEVIRSVVIEEMLHLLLARNLLLSVGVDASQFKLCDAENVPVYPAPMRYREPELMLGLGRLSSQSLDTFLAVEAPEPARALPDTSKQVEAYHTLGEFYDRIAVGFRHLNAACPDELWASTNWKLQLSGRFNPYWNESGGGGPVVIGAPIAALAGETAAQTKKRQHAANLASALQAIATIIRQGEGSGHPPRASRQPADHSLVLRLVPRDPTKPAGPSNPPEFSHYDKFELIKSGWETVYVASDGTPPDIDHNPNIWPIETNPDPHHWPAPIKDLAEFFDACFTYCLAIIDEAFRTPDTDEPIEGTEGRRNRKAGLVQNMLTGMGALLYPIADLLVQQPLPSRKGSPPRHAAPAFRFRPAPGRTPPARKQHLLDWCDRLGRDFPALAGDNGPRRFLSLLAEV